MGFFERQGIARRDTRWLVAAFVVAVVVVVAVVDVVVMAFVFGMGLRSIARALTHAPGLVAGVTLLVLVPIVFASLAKVRELAAGGSAALAKQVGAVPVTAGNTADTERRLRNVVDEMAIAAGIAVPKVYVLRAEPGINAFAAGRDADDAAVIVTEGALAQLNREELQAVVAHEFSHVLNGDMALNLRLAAWLHGLYVISLLARKIMRNDAGKRRFFRWYLFGLALLAVGSAGHVAARVLQAAVSRKREELADASAVQFTRNPLALKNALLKIARHEAGSTVAAPGAAGLAHMFFASSAPVRWQQFMQSLLATHPPLEERIRALDPMGAGEAIGGGDGGDDVRAETSDGARAVVNGARAGAPAGIAGTPGLAPASAPVPVPVPTPAPVPTLARTPPSAASSGSGASLGALAASVAAGSAAAADASAEDGARALRALEVAARAPATAQAVALAVVTAVDPAQRRRHLAAISRAFGEPAAAAVGRGLVLLDAAPPRGRLLAVTKSLEPLASLPEPARTRVAKAARTLVGDVRPPSVLQVCFAALLEARCTPRTTQAPLTLKEALPSLAPLLAVLATFGHADARRQQRAYGLGTAKVAPLGAAPAWAPPADRLRALLLGFEAARRLHPAARRPVADALGAIALEDARVGTEEAEIVRTACLLMGVSVPPLGEDVGAGAIDVSALLASAR